MITIKLNDLAPCLDFEMCALRCKKKKKKDVKHTNSSCRWRKGREATDKAPTSPLLRRLGLQQVPLKEAILRSLPYREISISKSKSGVVLWRPELCCDTLSGMSAFSPVLFSLILGALGSL